MRLCADDYRILRDVADIANREDTSLPTTDEVHAFLDMLHDLTRLRD